jgi:hypothetical protein
MIEGGVKSITLKNEFGETIEVRRGEDGGIQIRHSDIDRKRFCEFREITEPIADKVVAELFVKLGKNASKAIGSYALLDGNSNVINPDETAMIREAIKQLG